MVFDIITLGVFLLINGWIQVLLYHWFNHCEGMKALSILLGGMAHGVFTVLTLTFALGSLLEHHPPS